MPIPNPSFYRLCACLTLHRLELIDSPCFFLKFTEFITGRLKECGTTSQNALYNSEAMLPIWNIFFNLEKLFSKVFWIQEKKHCFCFSITYFIVEFFKNTCLLFSKTINVFKHDFVFFSGVIYHCIFKKTSSAL